MRRFTRWGRCSNCVLLTAIDIQVARSQYTAHAAQSVFTFTPRTPADFGRVTCSAANSVGEGGERPCVFIIQKKVLLSAG